MITVTFSDEWLTLSGTPAEPGSSSTVVLRARSNETTLQDNDDEFIDLPTNNVTPNRFIDARDVTDARLWLFATPGVGEVKVLGSEGRDLIISSTSDMSTFNGGRGDDRFILQGSGDSKIVGGRGNDIFEGGLGNDTIWGGRGDDLMTGGGGVDVLMYSGNFADYTLGFVNGRYQIVDNVGKEGTDVFTGFTTVQFADQAVAVDPTLTNIQISVVGENVVLNGNSADDSGRVSLNLSDNRFTVYDNDAASSYYQEDYTTNVTGFDGRGFLGMGVTLSVSVTEDAYIRGTRNDDDISFYSDTNDIVVGKGGDDLVRTHFGDDWISGGRGDDSLDGGLGDDTISYSGNRADYDIEIVEGMHVITHLNNGKDGTDTFTNVENIAFADETIAIGSPTDITTELVGQRLTVEGEVAGAGLAARPGAENWQIVTDEGVLPTIVEVEEIENPLRVLDLRGITGKGAFIGNSQDTYLKVLGSDQNDFYLSISDGDAKVFGFGGNDFLYGDDGNDSIYGGEGNDRLQGGRGEDLLRGGDGNDNIDGGEGDDTMILRNNFDEYVFTDLSDGEYEVEHTGGSGRDGLDEFTGIESIQFKDQTVLVDDLVF